MGKQFKRNMFYSVLYLIDELSQFAHIFYITYIYIHSLFVYIIHIHIHIYIHTYYTYWPFHHGTHSQAATNTGTQDNSQLQAHAPGITFRFSSTAEVSRGFHSHGLPQQLDSFCQEKYGDFWVIFFWGGSINIWLIYG